MFKKLFPLCFILILCSLLIVNVACRKDPADATPNSSEETVSITETEEVVVEEEIKGTAISQDKLPEGWTLDETIVVTGDELKDISAKLGPGITGIENYFLNYGGELLQINFIYTDSAENAEKIFPALIKMVGTVNVLALKGSTVMEFITANDSLIKDLDGLLFTDETKISRPSDFSSHFPELSEYLLKEGDIRELTLNKEFISPPEEVEGFSKKFGAEVTGAVHQNIGFSDGKVITVNYILCKNEADGQTVCNAMKDMGAGPVIKKGPVVIEIFEQMGDTGEVKENIIKYFEEKGFEL